MIAVGIDVSKSKSTVAILNGDGSIRAKPFDVHHVADELQALVDYIKKTSEPPTILMEPTSHYHYPLLKAFTEAELPVCLINPYQMKKYGDTELRKAKTDKRDSLRIAQYALEKSYSLIPYTPQDQKYEDLRFLSRQYSQRISALTVAKVQLLSLLDETMPGITTILPLKSRDPDNCVLLRFIKGVSSFKLINSRVLFQPMNDVVPFVRCPDIDPFNINFIVLFLRSLQSCFIVIVIRLTGYLQTSCCSC